MADKQAQQIMEKYAKNCYEAWKFYWIIRRTTWRSFALPHPLPHSLLRFHKRNSKNTSWENSALQREKHHTHRRSQAQQHWIAWIELRVELTQAAFGFFVVFR